jgi:protein-disulfide isomerase
MKLRHLLAVFIPTIAIASFALFIRVIQYQSLNEVPENDPRSNVANEFKIPIYSDDPIVGDKRAPITLVAFEDFGCEGCKDQNFVLNDLRNKYEGKIKIIWKMLPVVLFPFSTNLAHEYGYCINKQKKFEEFKELAFANSQNLSPPNLGLITEDLDINLKELDSCLESGEATNYLKDVGTLARSLNIQGVPRIFLNNKQLPHVGSVSEWERILELTDNVD